MIASIALELTKRCNLTCPLSCYAQASPTAAPGSMRLADWISTLDQARNLGARKVQLIGGEPTLYPSWTTLLEYALAIGMRVEVFSNLTHVQAAWWPILAQPGVNLATSYYSDDPAEHDELVGQLGSYARTRANIVYAVDLGIPVSASIVVITDGQRSAEAEQEVRSLGVSRVRVDHVRKVGNGARGGLPTAEELCGRCGDQRAAIGPDGDVGPCVIGSQWLSAGNVQDELLADILAGAAWTSLMRQVPARSAAPCNPDSDGNDCGPAETDWEPDDD